ncbi:MAG TPA: PRC-barrel domain-containing protein, partial [Acidimicrobiales bacterium]|nr:PRC-barrel domain-containing protein [Acidimicrobiales bacterium]
MDVEHLEQFRGRTLLDVAGERVGRIDDVYLNEATREPEWIRVSVGPLATRSTLVPVARLEVRDTELHVTHDRDFVRAAPAYFEARGALPPANEAELFEYYG